MNSLTMTLQSLAAQWAAWCASGLIGASLVLAVIFLVAFPIWKNRSPQLLGILFFLVLLKPMVPIQIELPQRWSSALPSRLTALIDDAKPVSTPATFSSATSNHSKDESGINPSTSIGNAPELSILQTPLEPNLPNPTRVANSVTVSSSSVPDTSVASAGASSLCLVGFTLYALVVVFLISRFAINQVRFHRLVKQTSPLEPQELPIDFADACRRAGLRHQPRLIEMQTGSPAVWGIFRTTVILPTGMIGEMSTDSLRWAVMHELAHVKRHDIIFHAFQKLLTLAQFWNPAVWIASAMIDRFREQSCDDMALLWSDRQSVSAGEAFMHVVRSASQASTHRPLAASLGVFSSGNRRACAKRLRRILDSERPLRDRISRLGLLFLLISAILLLPKLSATVGADPQQSNAGETRSDGPPAENNDVFIAAKAAGQFELILSGPDNERIPHAQVEIRPKSDQPWTILAGTFERDASYGTFIKTDAEGRLVIKLPNDFDRYIAFNIKASGYGPFWAQWHGGDKSEVMPSRYVAHLDKGQNVGGIVVDESGKPVVGAKVHPSIEYKKRENDEDQLSIGWSATTDDQGGWNCDYVPADFDHLSVEVTHDEFVPTAMRLDLPKYTLDAGASAGQTMVINRGTTLTGKITDQDGNPIADAAIRTVLINETRVVRSDADGNYRLPGFPAGSHAVTVTAAKRSPEQKNILFKKEMGAVDFTLQPGHTVRVRVIDGQGNPQPKARIFFRNWRLDNYGKGLGMVHAYTDENGIWEWNEAPADAFVADVCPVDGVTIDNQVLTARDQEYLFTSMKQLRISGTVVDAETQLPIPSFRVVPGLVWPDATEPFWTRRDSFDSRDGLFSLVQDRRDARHAVRIEADGYRPTASRFIDVNEGLVELKLELKTTSAVSATIRRPDGSPAVGAQAAIGIKGAQIGVQSGEFTSTFAQTIQTGNDGRLEFPPDEAPIRLVVLDQTGYADVVIEPDTDPAVITLTAWATIEGTLMHGNRIAANEWLTLSPRQSAPSPDVINLSWRDRIQTDDQGRFRFDRVRPGMVDLFQEIRTHNTGQMSFSAISSRMQFNIESAEIKSIDIGGDGYSVTATATTEWTASSPGGAPAADWEFSRVSIKPVVGDRPSVPYPDGLNDDQKKTWYQEWKSTDSGIAFERKRNEHFLQSIQNYGCKVDTEGRIRVDDLPAGKYVLSLELDERPAEPGYAYVRLGEAKLEFEISADQEQDQPKNLGTIVVRRSKP